VGDPNPRQDFADAGTLQTHCDQVLSRQRRPPRPILSRPAQNPSPHERLGRGKKCQQALFVNSAQERIHSPSAACLGEPAQQSVALPGKIGDSISGFSANGEALEHSPA
jgi:hypothetical protein